MPRGAYALSDEELIDYALRTDSAAAHELAKRLLDADSRASWAVDHLVDNNAVVAAVVSTAKRASLLLDLHATQCKEVVEGTKALDDAIRQFMEHFHPATGHNQEDDT